MIEQIWITGVLASFSIFGVKVGMGLASQIYSAMIPMRKKVIIFSVSIFIYFALFGSLYFIIEKMNLLNYLDEFMKMVRFGMLFHLVIAVGLLVWGVKLLLENSQCKKKNSSYRASYLLIMPCPICATAILLNLTFAHSISDLSPWLITLILFAIFVAFIIISIAAIYPFRNKIGSNNNFLGISMSFVALYFFLTLIISPIYPTIKDTFRMAISNNPINAVDHHRLYILLGIVSLLLGFGFMKDKILNKELSK